MSSQLRHIPRPRGPEESKLRNRIVYWLTGHWPDSVVDERLAIVQQKRDEAIEAWVSEALCPRCKGDLTVVRDRSESTIVCQERCGYEYELKTP